MVVRLLYKKTAPMLFVALGSNSLIYGHKQLKHIVLTMLVENYTLLTYKKRKNIILQA